MKSVDRRKVGFAFLAMMLVQSAALGQEAQPGAVRSAVSAGTVSKDVSVNHVVPFSFRDHLIVVQASVNGRSLNSMIDTGANQSFLDQGVADDLGLEPVSKKGAFAAFETSYQAERVLVEDLQIGPILIGTHCIVRDLSAWRVDAIIGLDVLRSMNFTIDFDEKTITFGDDGPLESSIPFVSTYNLVIVPVSVGGEEIRLSVDTGAERISLVEARIKHRVPEFRIRVQRQIGTRHLGRKSWLKDVRLLGFQMGSTTWKQLPALVIPTAAALEKDGVLGVASLRLKRIRFDFERRILSWEK